MIALSIGPTSSSATAFARSTAESRTAQGIDFQDRIEDADLGSNRRTRLDARRGPSSPRGPHRARDERDPGSCGDGFGIRGSPLGNRGEPHCAELTTLERAEHISQWIRLRNQTAESQPCDQADNKLGQVGPVSELNKVAPVAPVLAPGGRGREGGICAAALMGRRQSRPGTDPTEISRALTRRLPQTDELLRRETLSAPPKPSIPR